MLTREEKKKLRDEQRQRESRAWLLQSPSGEDIATIIVQGNDFWWTFGILEPLVGFEQYRSLFDEAARYHQLAQEAEDQNQNDQGDRFTEKEFVIYEAITNLGLKIWASHLDGFVEYNTLNICGLEIEWK